jgi:hypothetical protein
MKTSSIAWTPPGIRFDNRTKQIRQDRALRPTGKVRDKDGHAPG